MTKLLPLLLLLSFTCHGQVGYWNGDTTKKVNFYIGEYPFVKIAPINFTENDIAKPEPAPVVAQIKIGDITISDSLAKEYFLDCHKHPDTLKKKYPNVSYADGAERMMSDLEIKQKIEMDRFNQWLDENNIKVLRKYGNHNGIKYIEDEWYLMPRQPSASDFAAFMRRKYKQP